jgi:hypothetical protein
MQTNTNASVSGSTPTSLLWLANLHYGTLLSSFSDQRDGQPVDRCVRHSVNQPV